MNVKQHILIYVALDEEYPLYGQDIYIIGNIHENPDLLEQEDVAED